MLEVKDLYKKYKSKSGVIVNALNGISLKLPKKGMVFILGKSGSGKSTLLNVLGGLDSYDSGDIIIKNKSSKSFRSKDFDSYRNTYVGFIFQEYNILDNFTVGQNIALAMKLQGKKPTSEDINSILKQVDLEGLGDRKPNELSGGQKQRVAIARALIKNPQIIMADEPTGALDSATGIQIFNTLKKLSSDKLVLIVSHDREFSERYADRIIEIKDGKVLSDVSLKSTEKAIKQNIIFATNEILVNHDYVLTGKDLKEINAFIRKNKSDTRIKAIKHEMRGRASFANTDQNKVIVDKGEFEVIKSRLPFSHAFKMGAGALKHKKFKLVLTIFLSLVSFTMLGLTSTFTFFRGPTALIDNWTTSSAIDFYNISKIGIQRISGFFGNMNYSSNIGLEDEDCQRIKTELSDIGYTFLLNPVYKDPDGRKYSQTISLYNNIGEQSSGHGVFLESFKYLGKSSDFQEYFGSYKLAGGKWPSASKEIVISRSIAQTFMKFGYCEAGKYPKETVEIYSIDKMIGKVLTFTLPGLSESNNFKVVGVLESGLDMTDSKYESIISSSGSSSNNKYYNEFNNLKEFSLSNAIVFSDDDYKIAESSGCTKTIFGSLPTDRSKLNKLANFVFKEYPSNLGSQYSYCSSMIYGSSDLISSTIRQTMAMTSSMKNIFLIIGLVFIVFSGLLFANFIANSISYQKKEIGILRAIGSRGSDVFRIYMCESFVIAMINFLLATVASWCVTNFAINPSVGSALSSLTGGTVSLLHFGLYSILIILGVSLLSAFLSTFIPIRNTAKKKPVEAIRNK